MDTLRLNLNGWKFEFGKQNEFILDFFFWIFKESAYQCQNSPSLKMLAIFFGKMFLRLVCAFMFSISHAMTNILSKFPSVCNLFTTQHSNLLIMVESNDEIL